MTVVLGLLLVLVASGVGAEPVAVRFSEGAAHGFVVLRGERGGALAHGELVQAWRGEGVQSRLVFRFADGSLHDETVTSLLDLRRARAGVPAIRGGDVREGPELSAPRWSLER